MTPTEKKIDLEFKQVVLTCLDDLLKANTFRSMSTMNRLDKLSNLIYKEQEKK